MSNMNIVLPQLAVDTEFTTLDMLKHACHAAAIQDNFEFNTVYSERRRYSIKCKAEECPWRLYAAPIFNGSTQFRIRIFNNEHICFGLNHCGHDQATASFISKKIHEKIQEQPNYRPSDIKKDIRRELGVQITYSKAWRAKENAITSINGSFEAAYSKLSKYCEDIERTNSHSKAIVETIEGRFKRIFICFGASAVGFQYCRPVLGLDGTHLKNKYQGDFHSHVVLMNQIFFSLQQR